MKIVITIISLLFFTSFVFRQGNTPGEHEALAFDPARDTIVTKPFPQLRDTLFTISDHIILINLRRFSAVVKSADGEDFEFKISPGTTALKKGEDTPDGLFTVLYKAPRAISRQFDNTPMLHWIGFHNSFGLHALETKGYYSFLGKKKSSHGCVRVRREDIRHVYKMVSEGTPVLVFSGKPGIAIQFTDTVSSYVDMPWEKLVETIRYRQGLLAAGEYYLYEQPKLLITKNNITNSGLPIGEADSIPVHQKIVVKKTTHSL